MRVLHITDNYKFTGGIQSYIRSLVTLLTRQGHEAEVYSPLGTREDLSSFLSRWFSYKYYSEVTGIVARFKPDIVHAHSVSMRISPLPLLAAKERGITVVMTVHDFNYVCPKKWLIYKNGDPCLYGFGYRCIISSCPSSKNGWLYLPYHNLRWMKTALHRRLLRKYVGTFICPSNVLCQRIKDDLGIQDVFHIPNFIERTFTSTVDLQKNNRLLFVGRLSAEKGVACLLRAMPLVLSSCPDALLTIVGDGPERNNLENLSHRLKIDKNVCFTGMIDRTNLPEYYVKATVCLLPSLWMENCPVSGLEALAFCKPIVGSNIGGIPEIVKDGVTGFLFRRNDHGDLAEKIGILLKNKDLLYNFSENALSVFQENYTEDKHCDRILSLYSSVVK